MANFDLGEEMKRIMLAGIGAVAETTEKAGAVVNHLVEKGEITIDQGKAINEELKRNIKDCVTENTAVLKKKSADAAASVDEVVDSITKMSAEQIQAIKEKLAAMDDTDDDAE